MQHQTLKQKAVAGTKWTTLSAAATAGVQFFQWAVLGRLLKPSDIGLMGMVAVVIGFATVFADMGISNAIIYRQCDDGEKLSSLYWVNISAGIVLAVILCLISPVISFAYNETRLVRLICLTAWVLPVTAAGQQFQVLLQKDLKFNQISVVEISSTFAGFISTISFALMKEGVYSLVWGQLTASFVKSSLFILLGTRGNPLHLHFRRRDLDGYLGFGLYQMGERVLNYFNSNLDFMLIGSLLGAKSLGYYTLAYNLVIQPVNRINPIITRVAFPVLAKVQDNGEYLKKGYLKVIKYVSFINIPILAGLIATTENTVLVLFGSQWYPSIILIQILAGVGIVRALSNPVGVLMLSKGRADLGFKWNLALFFIQIPGLTLGLHIGGTVGVAAAFLILITGYFIFLYIFPIRILIGNCFGEYFGSMSESAFFGAVMCILVMITGYVFGKYDHYIALVIQVAAGIIIYMGLTVLFRRNLLKETVKMVFGR